jgi:putative transposase
MRYYIEDSAFDRIYEYLRSERKIHTGNKENVRLFLEAMYWLARSGAQWRFLPEEYGYWNSLYQRFEDWSARGVWKRMFHYFSQDSDMEWLMIDSTIVRAHACASGGKGGRKRKVWDGVREAIAAKYT